MIKHGITTTKADYWAHVHPYDGIVYCYKVVDCVDYIKKYSPHFCYGHSKGSGKVTGEGYLIPKSVDFIKRIAIPDEYLNKDFANMTDRQIGVHWLRDELVPIMFPTLKELKSKKDQNECKDYVSEHGKTIEFKTEKKRSPNLFVQTAELNHEVNFNSYGNKNYTKF